MTFWKATGAVLTALVLFVLLIATVAIVAHNPSNGAGIALLLVPLAVAYWVWAVAIPWLQAQGWRRR